MSDRERRVVMVLVLALVFILFSSIWIISSLNLGYAKKAVSDIRSKQIEELFSSEWNRISEKQNALERYTLTLAHLGEHHYRLYDKANLTSVRRDMLWRELMHSARQQLDDFSGVSGLGVWFEPGLFSEDNKSEAIHYQRLENGVTFREQNLSKPYRDLDWYKKIVDYIEIKEKAGERQTTWSAAYFDLQSERAQFIVSSEMFDESNSLIGRVITEWAADEVIELVDQTRITKSSFSFIVDKNNRNLTSLVKQEQSQNLQQRIDAVINLDLPNQTYAVNQQRSMKPKRQNVEITGQTFQLLFNSTSSGLIFGMGVPVDEIDNVLEPLSRTNANILVVLALVLCVFTVLIIRKIYHLMLALRAARRDPLTGLPNRFELLKHSYIEQQCGLILVNVDRLREFNGLFGQACGDKILQSVAHQISDSLTAASSSDQNKVYRLPGDEFVLKIAEQTNTSLSVVAHALVKNISELDIAWQDQVIQVHVTAGGSLAKEVELSTEKLLEQASIALQEGRIEGKPVSIFSEEQSKDQVYEHNLYWAKQLKSALIKQRLFPFFQPIYCNQQNEITKYECLIRMKDESGNLISPTIFLDIANKLRLMRELTCVMLDACFEKFECSQYEFSINLTYADIADEKTLATILRHLSSSKAASRVVFEILESDEIADYEHLSRFIESVKPFGAQVAIDDFGTGYSNFEHLLKLKIDIIKIDGSLIKHIAHDENALLVVEGIVSFASSLGIKTVAEYVHNEKVQEKIKALNIDFSQGAYFGMPDSELQS